MVIDNIVPFKKNITPDNIPEWLYAYATLIAEMKEELRPTNILIVENYVETEDTSHNLWIAGPKMKALSLIGLLDAVKFMVQHESLT